MSHITEIQIVVRDLSAMRAACRPLGLAETVRETGTVFSSAQSGYSVWLRGWRYPVVFDLALGEMTFDAYGGNWGQQGELDRFVQAYSVEMASLEARRRGHAVSEQLLADGSILLV